MNERMEKLEGLEALGSGLAFRWNAPMGEVERILREAGARSLQKHGSQMLRFEESVVEGEQIDLQYELRFSPDYGFGLRDADVKIEIVGLRIDERGGTPRFFEAFGSISALLERRYGPPDTARNTGREELAALAEKFDGTRAPVSAMALWLGPKAMILHELAGTHTLKQRTRFSPIANHVVVRNDTGRDGLQLRAEFPEGAAIATLAAGQEREIEVPPGAEVSVSLRQEGKSAGESVHVRAATHRVSVRRRFLFGGLVLKKTMTGH